MVRFSVAALLAAVGFIVAWPAVGQQPRKSPHETISEVIGGKGGNRITISYGRPLAKGRKIWGDLVPYGKAWRTGADEATLFVNQAPIKIGDATIPAGSYTLYTVPAETGVSKLAFSKKIGAWGIPVNEKDDLVRVDMKKEALDKKVEQFTISITPEKGGQSGVLKLMWEDAQFSVAFANAK
jgi:Protein of unknown function (DUF2911)